MNTNTSTYVPKRQISEFILPGHPDKLCDRIADRLVDAACARDAKSLVGVEVALHQQVVLVTGCITTVPAMTISEVDDIVRQVFRDAGYDESWLSTESLRIDHDLRLEELDDDLRGLRSISDDQAICVGYAGGTLEDRYLPKAHRLAYLAGQHMLAIRHQYGLGPDGKVIVTCDGDDIEKVSISLHHHPDTDRRDIFKMAWEVAQHIGLTDPNKLTVNGGGDFDVGGPWGDNGLSGKKLVVDAYGPHISIGGGAWSGKDPHKIDRVGGLMARYLALYAIRMGLGTEARVTIGWHPGDASPSYTLLEVDGQIRKWEILGPIDCSIDGVWSLFRLGEVNFADYADGSWFQRSSPWDVLNRSERVEQLEQNS